jgi:Fic family protein
MDIIEKIKTVNSLKNEVESYGKFPEAILRKINYKFRLDWNYYSNSMEGNTLTRSETRSIMIGNVTLEGKPIKDVLEIKGHDDIIEQILKIGRGEMNISERRIKDLHKAIIHEEDPEKKKEIGEWKIRENEIINYKGEKFEFSKPSVVKDEMHSLLNWLSAEADKIKANKKDAMHPAILAFDFHLRYLTIHPFYDGNGRTARILMNLILISYGFPPVIIKLDDKTIYYQYLADIQCYEAPKDFYFSFMLSLLIRSQELVLKAVKGEDIEDPDDLDKKIALLEKELEAVDPDNEVKWKFKEEVFYKIYDGWFSDLIKKVVPVIQKFNKFFTETQHHIWVMNNIGQTNFVNESADEILKSLRDNCTLKHNPFFNEASISFNTSYGILIKGGQDSFGCRYSFEIKFEPIKYSIAIDKFIPESSSRQQEIFIQNRLLHKPLTEEEINSLSNKLTDAIYSHIDYYTKKNGLR